MKVQVDVMGHLIEIVEGLERNTEVQLEEGTALDAFLRGLGIKQELVYMVLINGQRMDRDYLLKDGDRVTVFSPPAGG